MRAVGALKQDEKYRDRFDYEILSMGSEAGDMSRLLYDWGTDGHGLVVLGPDGEVLEVLKGHAWGGNDQETALEALRAAIDPHL